MTGQVAWAGKPGYTLRAVTTATKPSPKTAAVIGAGPAGLIAAETLARAGVAVTIHDRMPSVGRKFLLAGRGGLNLTHSEPLDRFLTRYGAIDRCSRAPSSTSHRRPYAPGRSARQDDLRRLQRARVSEGDEGVALAARMAEKARRKGRALRLAPSLAGLGRAPAGCASREGGRESIVQADVTILALGGASWPRLGSDAAWADLLAARGVAIAPLKPSNCGFTVAWSEAMRRFEGVPLKRIALTFGERSVRGEALITREGIEGGGVYALSAPLRDADRRATARATLHIDLRPDLAVAALAEARRAARQAVVVERAAQGPQAAAGRHRAAARSDDGARRPLTSLSAHEVAALIKAVPVRSDRRAADRDRDLDGRRRELRRARCAFHVEGRARRIRRRRDARLGGADRRLPAAGLLRHRRCGGRGRAEMVAPGKMKKGRPMWTALPLSNHSPVGPIARHQAAQTPTEARIQVAVADGCGDRQ